TSTGPFARRSPRSRACGRSPARRRARRTGTRGSWFHHVLSQACGPPRNRSRGRADRILTKAWRRVLDIFSFTDEGGVTEVFGPGPEIGRRAEAAKRLEIANEMRLVVVTAVQGDPHPLDPRRAPERPQHSLEASDSAEQLGRQPHLR